MRLTKTHYDHWAATQKKPSWTAAIKSVRDDTGGRYIDAIVNINGGEDTPTKAFLDTCNAVALLKLVRGNNRRRSATSDGLARYLHEYVPHKTCPPRRVALFKRWKDKIDSLKKGEHIYVPDTV